ncbi:MAG TPA: hypothetical protein VM577_07810 [Anaerovoracaceae bacterium]|nr:hypothetical protein [Anaerovoracaceae bacterium]
MYRSDKRERKRDAFSYEQKTEEGTHLFTHLFIGLSHHENPPPIRPGGRVLSFQGKAYAIGLMWASILFSCYLVPLLWARGFMLTSAVLVTVYILRQKTLRKS